MVEKTPLTLSSSNASIRSSARPGVPVQPPGLPQGVARLDDLQAELPLKLALAGLVAVRALARGPPRERDRRHPVPQRELAGLDHGVLHSVVAVEEACHARRSAASLGPCRKTNAGPSERPNPSLCSDSHASQGSALPQSR